MEAHMKKGTDLKSLLVRIPKDIYIQMRHISIETNISLNQYVVEYFTQICKAEKGIQNEKK